MNELVEKINLLWDSFSKDADALAFLGEIYVEIKEFTEGKKFLEQSAKLNPENQDVLVLLGDLASQNSDYNTRVPCSIYRRIKKINFCEKGRTLLFRGLEKYLLIG